MKKNNRFSTKQIAYVGLFVALGVVVNTLRVGVLSFGGLPIIISGYALGPFYGLLVGAVTDIVAYMIRPSAVGWPHPLFTLTSALTGFIPVMVNKLLGDKYPKYNHWKMLIAILIGQFITSVFIVNWGIDRLFAPGTFYAKAIISAQKQAIQAPIYALIAKVIIDRTSNIINYRN